MKVNLKELPLLAVPVIIFIGIGAFNYQQEKIERERFKPFAQAVNCEYLPRAKEGKQTARIEILVSPQGTIPSWWGKNVTVNLEDTQFHVPGRNTWTVPISYPRAEFDAYSRQYTVVFQRVGNGSQLFSLYRGMLRGKITFVASGSGEKATIQFNQILSNIKGQPSP